MIWAVEVIGFSQDMMKLGESEWNSLDNYSFCLNTCWLVKKVWTILSPQKINTGQNLGESCCFMMVFLVKTESSIEKSKILDNTIAMILNWWESWDMLLDNGREWLNSNKTRTRISNNQYPFTKEDQPWKLFYYLGNWWKGFGEK